MDIRYQRDDARRRIYAKVAGDMSLAALSTMIQGQADDLAWTYGLLCDLRQVTKRLPDHDLRELMAQMAAFLTLHGPRGPVAVVTDDPELIGMVETYGTLSAAFPLIIQCFPDLTAADAWLTALSSRSTPAA